MANRFRRLGRGIFRVIFNSGVARKRRLVRRLVGESLESRQLMAADVYRPYYNDLIPEDTNRDYAVTPLDALLIINSINQGMSGALQGPGVGKAEGPMIDVNGDNVLSAIDALRVINRLNGEGEGQPLVQFSYEFADQNGSPLSSNSVTSGQLFQLRTFVQDARGFSAQGVFAAFLDLAYNNADKFQIQVGETQSLRFFFDKIRTDDTSSSFKLTLPTPSGGETTQPITLFNGSSAKSAEDIGNSMRIALEALPSVGAGNVLVVRDTAAHADDESKTPPVLRNSYEIKFVNAKAGQDIPLLIMDASNIKVNPGATFEFTLTDKFPADASNPNSFASSFIFTSDFGFNRTATRGNNEIDEVGAATGLGAPTNPSARRLMFFVTLKALSQGTVTFTPNAADVSPLHDVLVFPKDVVPTNMVGYGNPFSINIVDNISAANDTATVAEDSSATEINVTANDTAVAPRTFEITAVATPANGTATISADKKKINYTPTGNFFGADSFTYTVTSNLGETSTATVSVNVTPVNDPIIVSNKTFSTNEETVLELTTAQLTAGDSVGPGESAIQQLRLTQVASPSTAGGTVVLNAGKVTYTPPNDFDATDTFVVTITDDGQTNGSPDASTKNITVTVNVAPVNDPPTAVNDTVSVNEDTSLILAGPGATVNLTANDSPGPSSESSQLLAVVDVQVIAGTNGTISKDANNNFVFTPSQDFSGSTQVTYKVRDNGSPALEGTATVTINVQAVNDPPVAVNDTFNVDEDSTDNVLDVIANDNGGPGESGDTLTITAVGLPSNGKASIANGKINYTPTDGFIGTDTFSYTIRDQGNLTNTATVTVEVEPVVLPRARVDRVTIAEDIAAGIVVDVLSNDRPTVGSKATLLSFTQPAAGTVTRNDGGTPADLTDDTLTFVAPANFFGQATFNYVINDTSGQGANSTGTVVVSVTDVNDPPVLVNDTATATEDTSATISHASLLSNDSPGAGEDSTQNLTITSVSAVSNSGGSVRLEGSNVVYTPSTDFNGPFLFEYVATDNGTSPSALTGKATVTINVAAVNDAPIGANDTASTPEDTAINIAASTLLQNDANGPATATDENAQTRSVVGVSAASEKGGNVALNGTTVVYTPAANFVGQDTFTYTLRDNGSPNRDATATVTVTVTSVNDAPLAGADALTSFKDIALTIRPGDLLGNDAPGPASASDEVGQTVRVVGATALPTTKGQVRFNSDGTITYTPAAGFTGADTFQYQIEDNGQTNGANDAKSALGTITLNVQEFVPSKIAGTVYVDETGDGLINPNERRMGGVTVTLTGVALGRNVSMSQITLADGTYEFDTLAPGTYTVQFAKPALMIDGKDTAGALGDTDGHANNNQFVINVNPPGGANAVGYNFAVAGLEGGYGQRIDRLASSYFIANPTLAYNGFYAVIGSDNTAKWISKLDGFAGVLFAEVTLNASGSEAYLTIVDANHNIFTATLGKGKFLTLHDESGNTVVRVLANREQLQWRQVNLASPRGAIPNKYLASIDAIFAQEKW